MKTTGVVRKIDQLGRIVIPKEIRKSLGIKDGDGVEFLLEEDTIVLRKASVSNRYQALSDSLVNGVYAVTKKNLIITDLETVLSCNERVKSTYLGKKILDSYLSLIERREEFVSITDSKLDIVKEGEARKNYILEPLVVNGELIGSILLYSEVDEMNDFDKFILKFLLYFLEKNIEE